jgi:hypothetical protein
MKHLLFTATLLLATPAFAGSGHDHSHSHGGHGHAHEEVKTINESEAITVASKVLPQLVEQGHEIDGSPLDQSWSDVAQTGEVHKKGNGYFIISFAGNDEKTLYLLLSDSGEIYDANFSGEFDGLKG